MGYCATKPVGPLTESQEATLAGLKEKMASTDFIGHWACECPVCDITFDFWVVDSVVRFIHAHAGHPTHTKDLPVTTRGMKWKTCR